MNSTQNISDAALYTDFSGLQRLRTKVSGHENTAESQAATKEVAKQFESLFLQMMLKSMRDATVTGDSEEADQTRFYQEMFDKQIALDLANNENGGGLGIADLLARDLGGDQQQNLQRQKTEDNIALIRDQINLANTTLQTNNISEQE